MVSYCFFPIPSRAANVINFVCDKQQRRTYTYILDMSLPAAAAMLRLRTTASFARTCRRPLLRQQQQSSRSLSSASVLSSKLDKLLPQVEDFPSRHIGPRRHDAKDMLRILGFNVSTRSIVYKGHVYKGHG